MNNIILNEVSRKYRIANNTICALDDVSLNINKGDYLVIQGKSGSGKSTLLNIIGLIDSPTSGTIIMDDNDVTQYDNKKISKVRNQEIGYIFQSFYLEATYTVGMNVEMPLIIAGMEKKLRKAKVASVLEKVGLSDKIKNKAYELSGGERQRVCIARALVKEPDLILADEPCGNLDSENTDAILEILKQLNYEGKTIVLVTHSVEDGRDATRKILMKDGKII